MKTKNLSKKLTIIMVMILLLNILASVFSISLAAESTTKIVLSEEKITVNGEEISTDSSNTVYLSTSTNNGGTSEDATSANIEIGSIINITAAGTYEFTGTLSDGQISINSNDITGDVVIILNKANITCKNAPAIFVYNQEVDATNCNVTIKTASGTTNNITGSKIKQSVEGWENQDSILYYIEKDNDDDGTYYERYKYDGAISSDISLTFEGEGKLIVNSTAKEGIESKQDITFNSGNYEINSMDDGINACTDNESEITINGGTILVNVLEDAEEGDGIDSNGSVYINGGYVYAFAAANSADNGLDSDNGIYINGGYVVATGNMADSVNSDSKQNYLQLNFNSKVAEDTLIAITDKEGNAKVAFKSDRNYTILTISSPDLETENITVYEGGTIEGESQNGLYTNITSYTKGTEKSYSNVQERQMPGGFGEDGNKEMNNSSDLKGFYIILGILTAILIIVIVVSIISNKKGKSE